MRPSTPRSPGGAAPTILLLAALISLVAAPACTTPGQPPSESAVIASVAFLSEIHAAPARAAHVLYQDGALPTAVPGGTLWSFGDTFMGTRRDDGSPAYDGALSNTLALLPEGAHEFPPRLRYLQDATGNAVAPLSL